MSLYINVSSFLLVKTRGLPYQPVLRAGGRMVPHLIRQNKTLLFKKAGSGANYVDSFTNHGCVYLSGIFDIQDLLDDGTIIVGNYKKSRRYYKYRSS